MTDAPDWLPPLVTLAAHGGRWDVYEAAVYAVFKADFIDAAPTFRGMRIGLRRHPTYNNREWAFWHVMQEGNVETDRTPDMRRCERIGWVRAVIQNANDLRVKVWENDRRGDRRFLLWLEAQDFLVVLAPRAKGYAMLVTAYPTDRGHTRRKLQQEYAQAQKQASPAGEAGPNTPSTHGG
jgi:hypothetical protein